MTIPNFQVNYKGSRPGRKDFTQYVLVFASDEIEAKEKAQIRIDKMWANSGYSIEITTVEAAKLMPLF